MLSAFPRSTAIAKDNHSLPLRLGSCRQTPDRWGSRRVPAVHQHTPSIDHNMWHRLRHEISAYMGLLALASGNDTDLCGVEMEMREIIN